jgi:heptosyltransferase II
LARIVREPVECSPCLLRECPIDHRCMTRVTVEQVVEAVLQVRAPLPETEKM